MADLNKIQRSKERLIEILDYVTKNPSSDEKAHSFIKDIKKSIRIIDHKLEEFKKKVTW